MLFYKWEYCNNKTGRFFLRFMGDHGGEKENDYPGFLTETGKTLLILYYCYY